MNPAKMHVFDELNAIPESVDNEIEILDQLYHRIRLQASRESASRDGVFTTDEVRAHFRNRRERRVVSQ